MSKLTLVYWVPQVQPKNSYFMVILPKYQLHEYIHDVQISMISKQNQGAIKNQSVTQDHEKKPFVDICGRR